jgi:hypothetical protein
MTTEPGPQHQPFEAPEMASGTEQQETPPGATPAALRVQILSTEHWSLLATRSQTWNESFARAQMFLSVLSASVIALALVAQATAFGSGFTAFALVLLPVVLFLGLTTYIRLVAINHDETRWVLGMNRSGRPTWSWLPSWSGGSSPATTTTSGESWSPQVGAPSRPCSAMSRPRLWWGSSTPWSPV